VVTFAECGEIRGRLTDRTLGQSLIGNIASMSPDHIRRVDPADEEIEEEWVRETDDQDILGVGAWKSPDDDWRAQIWVAEFLREEPLESELDRGVDAALRSVEGVTDVVHEDREQWIAEGTPTGEALVRAAAGFVDSIADQARAYMNGTR
jgi:hypothetical protein